MTRHLVVCATKLEIKPVLERLDMLDLFEGNKGACFRRGPQKFDVLVSGIGQMQTSHHLGQALIRDSYSSVLNFGIAGSFREQFTIGSVVRVVQEELADLGVDDNGQLRDLFELGLLDPNSPPFQNGVLRAAPLELSATKELPQVNSVTVNRVLGSQPAIAAVVERYDTDVVNMEGASIFYACSLANVPCASIRSISNMVAPRDKSKWDIFGAIRNLCQKANEILDELQKR